MRTNAELWIAEGSEVDTHILLSVFENNAHVDA